MNKLITTPNTELICPFCKASFLKKFIRYWYTEQVYKCPKCGRHTQLPTRDNIEEYKRSL